MCHDRKKKIRDRSSRPVYRIYGGVPRYMYIFYTYAEMEYKKDTETKGSVTLWLTFDSEGGKKKAIA